MSESLDTLAMKTLDALAATTYDLERKDIVHAALRKAVEEERTRHGEYMDHVTRKRRQAEADLSIAVTALATHHSGEELTITKDEMRTMPLDRELFARYDNDGNLYVTIRSRSKESDHATQ